MIHIKQRVSWFSDSVANPEAGSTARICSFACMRNFVVYSHIYDNFHEWVLFSIVVPLMEEEFSLNMKGEEGRRKDCRGRLEWWNE